jgi:multidrug efflux pump subunit AcrA (membrane-fusion protein)
VIEAAGTVLPEVEEVISSPIDARVVRIVQRAGAHLEPGQPLVELDAGETRLNVGRLEQDLALKANGQEKTRLELQRSLNDRTARRASRTCSSSRSGRTSPATARSPRRAWYPTRCSGSPSLPRRRRWSS